MLDISCSFVCAYADTLQEIANPRVRRHLHFLPEKTSGSISEAWQAARWLDELDPSLLTQVVHKDKQAYFVYEPALLSSGEVCIPVRWFMYRGAMHAKVWMLRQSVDGQAWIVPQYEEKITPVTAFIMPFNRLVSPREHEVRNMPSPCNLGT